MEPIIYRLDELAFEDNAHVVHARRLVERSKILLSTSRPDTFLGYQRHNRIPLPYEEE